MQLLYKIQDHKDFNNLKYRSGVLADSGGASVGVANLTLPGDFAFDNQGTSAMIPADPSLQNRRRRVNIVLGKVEVS